MIATHPSIFRFTQTAMPSETTITLIISISILLSALSISLCAIFLSNSIGKRIFRYRVRQRLDSVTQMLFSNIPEERMLGAVKLRSFFSTDTEMKLAQLDFDDELLSIIAGLLRLEEQRDDLSTKNSENPLLHGKLQKTLADSLRYARTLNGADFQSTKLDNAYLGSRLHLTAVDGINLCDKLAVSIEGADFFSASLCRASLRGADARNAVFYKADLVGTIFRDADLTGANFCGANLTEADFRSACLKDAVFEGAELRGANFSEATDVPHNLLAQLHEVSTGVE